jgi:nucleoside 2-deoxyribosyltransferase
MPEQRKVFVSFSYPTSSWTNSFLDGLRKHGLNPFPNAGQKSGPDKLAPEVRKNLEQSHYVIVVWDQASTASPSVAFEIGAATSLGKPIVAVLDPKLGSGAIPQYVKRLPHLVRAGPKATAEQVATAIGKLNEVASSLRNIR